LVRKHPLFLPAIAAIPSPHKGCTSRFWENNTMFSNAMFHVVNIAGGLRLDPRIWSSHFEDDAYDRRLTHAFKSSEPLMDAAEQLRRLTRYSTLSGMPAQLLANALEIVERESLNAQRKSRSIATKGLSAGGMG
jgi:hypothetical protein